MKDGFIYEMPCLGKYRFNYKGECIRVYPYHEMTLYTGQFDANRIWKPKPHYYLLLDNNQYERVTLEEIQQYIRHCEYVMETVLQKRIIIRA